MTALYIRGVAPDAVEVLKQRAAAEGLSLSAYVAQQLTVLASIPTNAEVVEQIRQTRPAKGPSTDEIVDVVRQGRGE